MALTEISSGTYTTTDATETQVVDITSAGVYTFEIDTNNMVNGDLIELRIYTKVLSGGTRRVAWTATYQNVQGAPNKYSVPVPAMREFRVTLKNTTWTGGQNRDFPWTVLAF